LKAIWTRRGFQARLLLPVAALFRFVVFVRSTLFKIGFLKSTQTSVPVIVVGNISVGGTGKTPIVGAIVKKLQDAGYRPGIVSRGYGAVPANEPRLIAIDTSIEMAGDEPAMLLRQTGVPVCICTKRADAVEHLAKEAGVNVVVSDDGLQHYAMERVIEIAVIDGQRMLGNGWLLPAGPLREPPNRLNSVDVIAIQQATHLQHNEKCKAVDSLGLGQETRAGVGCFYLNIIELINLGSNERVGVANFANRHVHAVAGVGNPQRFFSSLRDAKLNVSEHVMPDHHKYVPEDVQFNEGFPVLMTAKDAVKVREFDIDLSNMFEVSVSAVLDESLDHAIDMALNTLQ